MPLLGRPLFPRHVTDFCIIVHAQEIANAIPILILPLLERNDAMHDTHQLAPRREAHSPRNASHNFTAGQAGNEIASTPDGLEFFSRLVNTATERYLALNSGH